ncbi:hypothetical protein LTR37_006234 [Vermiconidia calcicola]|uniref:Uncharacterized protein n=1 Tax=Vermiconidia calcicola TaxID=1690605 RepID=A0ACC3NHV6_9PEZI|nr:hypothetical protein LTR37_006234 [Vermiconidia calcicola]
MAAKGRFILSKDQLEQYFDRIALPKARRVYSVSDLTDDESFTYLQTLIKHQQVRIPFENLTLHYSWHRVIDVTPRHVFRKVMSTSGRGGYCMEANTLFHTVILSLGFSCYTAAARVGFPSGNWGGWSHLVNLVTIGGTKYLCDVGFGPNEPTVPMPLNHGVVRPQIVPAESRIVFETLAQNLSDSKLWICQARTSPDAGWTSMYCFTEVEILPTDVPGMNFAPMRDPASHFTQKVLCVRLTTSKERSGNDSTGPGATSESDIEEGKIDGALIVDHDKLKWRRSGKTVLEAEFKSEEERVQALRKYWGIELDVEDREAILGTVSAVKEKE